MENAGKVLLSILLFILSWIVTGAVFMLLWRWFVVPKIGVTGLSLAQSVGLCLTIRYVCSGVTLPAWTAVVLMDRIFSFGNLVIDEDEFWDFHAWGFRACIFDSDGLIVPNELRIRSTARAYAYYVEMKKELPKI